MDKTGLILTARLILDCTPRRRQMQTSPDTRTPPDTQARWVFYTAGFLPGSHFVKLLPAPPCQLPLTCDTLRKRENASRLSDSRRCGQDAADDLAGRDLLHQAVRRKPGGLHFLWLLHYVRSG